LELQGEKIEINFDLKEKDFKFDHQIEQHIYRIVQQALENAARHAKASRISFNSSISSEGVTLEIIDDGVGFELKEDFNQLKNNDHFGLVNMSECTKLNNAAFRIESASGKGTRVFIDWQVPQTEILSSNKIQANIQWT
jgi:two-component system sensor histidine kinase DegS